MIPSTFKSGSARKLLEQNFGGLKARGVVVCAEVLEQDVSTEIVQEVCELRFLGYLVALDDFGTGYSNLSAVQDLGPDYLKIDRSFTKSLVSGKVKSSLIPGIIHLARIVESEIIAEGIETADQARILTGLGVEFGQGFLFGRPMLAKDFGDCLENQLEEKEIL